MHCQSKAALGLPFGGVSKHHGLGWGMFLLGHCAFVEAFSSFAPGRLANCLQEGQLNGKMGAHHIMNAIKYIDPWHRRREGAKVHFFSCGIGMIGMIGTTPTDINQYFHLFCLACSRTFWWCNLLLAGCL
jgi:hypothetical protein